MEAAEEEGTLEAYYGLSVRKATEEEKNQDGANFIDGITSGGVTVGWNLTRNIKQYIGFRQMYDNGVGEVDK